jgi:hypothetical protein
MTGPCELVRSSRLSEAQKKAFDRRTHSALAQAYADLPSLPARLSELIDTISGEQYLSRA